LTVADNVSELLSFKRWHISVTGKFGSGKSS